MKNISKTNKIFIPINKGQFTLETEKRTNDFEEKRGFGVENDYKENRKLWTEYAKNQHVSDFQYLL